MNVLLLGGGGREHALAWKLRQSPQVERVFALPGSDGIASLATCLAGDPCDAPTVLAAATAHAVDLTVVGPEAPLAAGVADALRAAGRAVFGPSRAAAQLETSKIFAKEFLQRHRIPTARFAAVDSLAAGRQALARFGCPVVLKADGLAAGKGVVIATDPRQAEQTLEAMLAGALVGAAGRRVVLEECLRGPELSLLALADGERWRLLPPARDHKRLLEGDRGPNTGGMGAFSCDALLPPALQSELERSVVAPTLAAMALEGHPFQGVLYCGLMLTPQGPRVLEFNVRFGDPEAQAILPRWGGDLAATLLAASTSGLAHAPAPAPNCGASACVVAASAGYPGPCVAGEPIAGLEPGALDPTLLVFHAGTRRRDAAWLTAGGRVLAVAARAATLDHALALCYRAFDTIHFRGMQLRRDIGKENPSL
ncbi:MAG TPA: phosphoribosylamine--glycine ligase [Terriglobales bacterium]|nr:phosphoribosylamine--glycine ligase [Terriglobales bacterium]